MKNEGLMNDFWKLYKLYSEEANKALNHYVNSLKWPIDSDEWKICRLYSDIHRKRSRAYIAKALPVIHHVISLVSS